MGFASLCRTCQSFLYLPGRAISSLSPACIHPPSRQPPTAVVQYPVAVSGCSSGYTQYRMHSICLQPVDVVDGVCSESCTRINKELVRMIQTLAFVRRVLCALSSWRCATDRDPNRGRCVIEISNLGRNLYALSSSTSLCHHDTLLRKELCSSKTFGCPLFMEFSHLGLLFIHRRRLAV